MNEIKNKQISGMIWTKFESTKPIQLLQSEAKSIHTSCIFDGINADQRHN